MAKIALVHDYIKEYGGAEKVLEILHEMWEDAPIYTSLYFPKFLGPHKNRFKKMDIRTSPFQGFPFIEKLISPFRILTPFVFRSFDLSSFDVIIVSQTGAYFPTFVRKGEAKLICYTHTPPRYLYGYKTAREWKHNLIFLVLGEIVNHFLRLTDFWASKNVDYFIANSEEVRARIRKFYRREAVVVYPPAIKVQSAKFKVQSSRRKDYYLTGGRLAGAKGIDIVIDAFIRLRKPLKIFGKGFAGYDKKLKAQSRLGGTKLKANIEFMEEVTEEQKFELMGNAKAYVFASYDEDFGITPVEAMSVGTPVIAYQSGGVKETVIDGKTGILYYLNDLNHLSEAVKKFERVNIKSEDCMKQAQKFSEERFRKEMGKFVKNIASQ